MKVAVLCLFELSFGVRRCFAPPLLLLFLFLGVGEGEKQAKPKRRSKAPPHSRAKPDTSPGHL
jgi:hypothetical protein